MYIEINGKQLKGYTIDEKYFWSFFCKVELCKRLMCGMKALSLKRLGHMLIKGLSILKKKMTVTFRKSDSKWLRYDQLKSLKWDSMSVLKQKILSKAKMTNQSTLAQGSMVASFSHWELCHNKHIHTSH